MMLRTLLALLLMSMNSAARAAADAPKRFSWNINEPFATFHGTQEEKRSQVDEILREPGRFNSSQLFIAADTACSLDRFAEAGFLLQAATIRGSLDLKNYPFKGGESPGVYLAFLRFNAQPISRSLIEVPQHLTKAVRQMENCTEHDQ